MEAFMLFLFLDSTVQDKPVQIRPWKLSDADFVLDASLPLDPRFATTIFKLACKYRYWKKAYELCVFVKTSSQLPVRLMKFTGLLVYADSLQFVFWLSSCVTPVDFTGGGGGGGGWPKKKKMGPL